MSSSDCIHADARGFKPKPSVLNQETIPSDGTMADGSAASLTSRAASPVESSTAFEFQESLANLKPALKAQVIITRSRLVMSRAPTCKSSTSKSSSSYSSKETASQFAIIHVVTSFVTNRSATRLARCPCAAGHWNVAGLARLCLSSKRCSHHLACSSYNRSYEGD